MGAEAVIVVTGALIARPETLDPLMTEAKAHVARSRAEPGCISHAVHVDADDPMRLFFFERWESLDALRAHGERAETRAFMAAVRPLVAGVEPLAIYDAAPVAA